MTLNPVTVVLCIGVSVLGSWTSLILLEQALINYQYHGMLNQYDTNFSFPFLVAIPLCSMVLVVCRQ
jgi:hypothetical protein